MSTRESDTATTIAAIAGIVIIIVGGCLFGYDHTLVKLGIAAIAGLGGFAFANTVRRAP